MASSCCTASLLHGLTSLRPAELAPSLAEPAPTCWNSPELRHQVNLIRNVANKLLSEMGSSLSYKVGTMIEVPRVALIADEVTSIS
ncbi:Pyruvate, phosphate dikinase, chloroplastic [Glycine max]|nr:Pyruvate, phosphate dikinase, chloroplastic [Glycine max]